MKCLIDLASRMEFSKLFDSPTKKWNKESLTLLVPRKFLEVTFICSSSFIIMKYRSEILQRKILYQVSIDNEFLKIHLLIELKIVSMIAPLQRRAFATLIASNSRSEKYSENTQVSKKETDNWHSAGRLRNRKGSTKWLLCKLPENFQGNIHGNIFFLILLRKTLHQECFLCSFLKYFRKPKNGFFWNYPGR